MPVPDFQTLMLPVLRLYADGQERSLGDARSVLGATLGLSTEELAELLPNSRQSRFANRVGWGHKYLKQAALLQSPARGVYRITDRGRDVLRDPPAKISIDYLTRYPEFAEFQTRSRATGALSTERSLADIGASADLPFLTPDEQVRQGYTRLRAALAEQLLERLKQVSPATFEQIVVRVLVAMGYGGTEEDAARVVGKSGDGGIDGIIKEDRLGLESIYIQAKRYTDGSVGRPEIQQFAGALQGQRARKGVFITTSAFAKGAIEYAQGLQNTMGLVDGPQLAELMIDYGVGVSEVQALRIMKLDEDWFGEE
jgi:restriction system protein